jgi:integrating conjugative element protein (TIGR03758 family)
MTPDQNTAFNTANSGSALDAESVGVFVASVVVALILTGFAWVVLSTYQSLKNPGTKVSDVAGKVFRAVFVVTIMLFFIGIS